MYGSAVGCTAAALSFQATCLLYQHTHNKKKANGNVGFFLQKPKEKYNFVAKANGMKAVLEIGSTDLNIRLIDVLISLFKQNVTEVVIRKSTVSFEEFDKTLKITDVIQTLKESGYNDLLLNDIETGLKNSSVYSTK